MARLASEPARSCTPVQLLFFLIYSVVLVLGGITLGQTSLGKRLTGRSRDSVISSRQRVPVSLQAPTVGRRSSPPITIGDVHIPGHDHGEEGSVHGGHAAVEHAHEHNHGEFGDGIPASIELFGLSGVPSATAGLSSEPPGEPGQEYASPLPAGFYMPADLQAEKRTIGWPSLTVRRPTDADLEGTALVTMATGDESARHALALLQSMRDCGTRIPALHVMVFRGGSGSRDCHDPASRKARGREQVRCELLETELVEVVSQVYLDAFQRLGATVTLDNPIPDTPYIANIPGGRSISWGMALNKLKVFGLSQYRKVLWVDSDVLVLHNIDHLLLEPDFTAAFTNDCCNRNADAKMSGGMWVFHPTKARWNRIQDMLNKPIPGTEGSAWMFGDMQVVLHAYGKVESPTSDYKEWPFSRDLHQGIVPGVRVLPGYVNMTDDILKQELLSGGRRGPTLPDPGLLPGVAEVAAKAAMAWENGEDDVSGTGWYMLDPRYDGLVGDCECQADRDLGPAYFTIHFTCLPVTPPLHKPGRYESEAEFMDHVRTRAMGCMRFYYLKWYDAYTRAMADRLPAPYYEGPPVRVNDPEADAITERNRQDAYDQAVAEERRRNGQA